MTWLLYFNVSLSTVRMFSEIINPIRRLSWSVRKEWQKRRKTNQTYLKPMIICNMTPPPNTSTMTNFEEGKMNRYWLTVTNENWKFSILSFVCSINALSNIVHLTDLTVKNTESLPLMDLLNRKNLVCGH